MVIIKTILIVLISLFLLLYLLSKISKRNSVYDNNPQEKNPFESKRVDFIYDLNDQVNADGERGHLIITGDAEYKTTFYEQYLKRVIDLIVSFFGLILLSPLLIGLALAIKITDPGPALFVQKRVGKNKQFFKLHKFRSMKMSTPHNTPTHMLENPEQYITKVGRFIRAHSLDELPQIWDIFVGNMSIIGPRPALWNQDVLISLRDKYNANNIKPGLTGLAQINGRDELQLEEKAKLDGQYVSTLGFLSDVKYFFGTVSKVSGDDSVVEGKVKQ